MAPRKQQIPVAARTDQESRSTPVQRARKRADAHPDLHRSPPTSLDRVAEPDNLVLEHLKRIQAELSAARERDREIISRLGNLEILVATLRREFGHRDESIAAMSVRMDRMSDRIDRIERRLELAD